MQALCPVETVHNSSQTLEQDRNNTSRDFANLLKLRLRVGLVLHDLNELSHRDGHVLETDVKRGESKSGDIWTAEVADHAVLNQRLNNGMSLRMTKGNLGAPVSLFNDAYVRERF